MAFADTAKLAVNLSLEGNFQSQISKADSSLSRLNSTVGNTANKIGNDLGKGIRNTAQNLERMAMVAGGLAIGAGVAAVKWAGDFQAQLQTINTIAFATPDALTAIGDGIRKTARASGQDLGDLTGAYYDLLSAGIKVKDAQSLLDQAVTLGIGALGTTTETVDLLTTAYNAYGLDAAGAAKATDMFAQAVADGKVKVSEISATFANVASIAKAAGIGIDQIAAAYGDLTAQGVPAAEVTTEMNRAIVELIKPNKALKDLQDQTKTSFADVARQKGLVVALEEMRVAAQKAGVPFADLFGRLEGYKFALQTTGPAFNNYIAELGRVDNSTGMAAKQAAEREQGFAFQLKRLQTNIHDAGITIGNYLLPPLADLSQSLSDFLAGHQDELKKFGENLGIGVKNAVMWFKSLDWSAIAAGLKSAAGFVQSLVGAFASLPTETKGLLLGLYGLNKLSGGAVVNIGVDLFKGVGGGLFQQFLGRGSVANPMFVVPVGGGLGGGLPGAAGGAAGIAGGLGASAGVVGAATILAVAAPLAAVAAYAAAQPYKAGTTPGQHFLRDQTKGQSWSLKDPGSYAQSVAAPASMAPTPLALTGQAAQALITPTALQAADAAVKAYGISLTPHGAQDTLNPKELKTATDKVSDEVRESTRLNNQGQGKVKSSVDYAKVENTRATDAATAAINASRDAIVQAIKGLGPIGVTVTAAAVTKAQATVAAHQHPTTMNRGGQIAS